MNKILRDYLHEILSVSKEGNLDTGVARDIFLNAVSHGKVPEGEAPEVKAVMKNLFPDWDFTKLKAVYDAQTGPEREADLADFNEAVRAYYKTFKVEKAE